MDYLKIQGLFKQNVVYFISDFTNLLIDFFNYLKMQLFVSYYRRRLKFSVHYRLEFCLAFMHKIICWILGFN